MKYLRLIAFAVNWWGPSALFSPSVWRGAGWATRP